MSGKREKRNRQIEKMQPRLIAAVHGENKKEAFAAVCDLAIRVDAIPDDHEGPVIIGITDKDLHGTTMKVEEVTDE